VSNTVNEITEEERKQFRLSRIRQLEYDAAVRQHPCPHCGAGIGMDCFSPSFHRSTTYHKDRRRLAGVR
jgi:hypothetical protein